MLNHGKNPTQTPESTIIELKIKKTRQNKLHTINSTPPYNNKTIKSGNSKQNCLKKGNKTRKYRRETAIITKTGKIFRNQEVFNESHIPEIIEVRKKEAEQILENLNIFIKKKTSKRTIIIGESCTGKTTILKHALNTTQNTTQIPICYINCRIKNTARKCYFEIYRTIKTNEASNSLSTEIIQQKITKKLQNNPVIIAIDNINFLNKHEKSEIINQLCCIQEMYENIKIALFITSDKDPREKLEKNDKNILTGDKIILEKYTDNQIYTIIKNKCREGFTTGVITDKQIKQISTNTINLRHIITKLNNIGEKIEYEKKDKFTDQDIQQIINT